MRSISICHASAYVTPIQTNPAGIYCTYVLTHHARSAGGTSMRTVSIFKNGNNRAIRLPRDLDFDGVSELEIVREGDSIILRPVRPTWGSFAQLDRADPDFMAEREDVVSDEGRFEP